MIMTIITYGAIGLGAILVISIIGIIGLCVMIELKCLKYKSPYLERAEPGSKAPPVSSPATAPV
jgi:hypothetical protein